MSGCAHETVHGPTEAGTWICHWCGWEVIPADRTAALRLRAAFKELGDDKGEQR